MAYTDGSGSGTINVRIRVDGGTPVLDSDGGFPLLDSGPAGADPIDPSLRAATSSNTAATDPHTSDPWHGVDVTAFRAREDIRPDFSPTGLVWASGSTTLWRRMLASSMTLTHTSTPASTPAGVMPCACAGPPLPGRRLAGADSMCWNHVVGDPSFLVNVRPPPPGTNAESANGGLSVPTAVGGFPVVLRNAAGVDVPVVLTNT